MPLVLSSASLATTGDRASLVFNATGSHGTGTPTFSVADRTLTVASTYLSGDGTSTLVFLFTGVVVRAGETVTASGTDVMSGSVVFTGAPVTNGSTVWPCGGPAARMMRNRCTIKRATTTKGTSSGAPSVSWATWVSGVCCSIQGVNTSEEDASQMRELGSFDFKGYFPPGTPLRSSDRITTITGATGLSGRTLEVVGDPVDQAGRAAFLFVRLRALDGND